MRLIDLSQPVFDQCPNCPAHPPITVNMLATHEKDGWQVEGIAITPHGGTHLDAPLHKFASGTSIDKMPLEGFVANAYIADFRGVPKNTPIDGKMFASKLPDKLDDAVVLIATGWGYQRARTKEWFYEAPHMVADGARWLAERNIRGVGIDHYSISCNEPENTRTHEVLLGTNKIWILEELHFPEAAFALPRPSKIWALPINIRGGSGAWCRPVLVAEA